MMGAHFNRNCRESKLALCVMASGFSATAFIIGSKTALTNAVVRLSGSLSQSTSEECASGVVMDAGSLRYCFRLSWISKSTRESMRPKCEVRRSRRRWSNLFLLSLPSHECVACDVFVIVLPFWSICIVCTSSQARPPRPCRTRRPFFTDPSLLDMDRGWQGVNPR